MRILGSTIGVVALAAVGCRPASPADRAAEALQVGRAQLAEGSASGLAAAEASFTAAEAAAVQAERGELALDALVGLAEVSDRIGNQRDSAARWGRVLAHPKAEARPTLIQDARLGLADALENQGDHEAAAEHATWVLAHAEQDSLQAARARLTKGMISTHLDVHQEALREMLEVIPSFERLGRLDLVAEAWGTIASAQARLGDWEESLASVQKGIRAAEAAGDSVAIATNLNREAVYWMNYEHEWARGIEVYDRAIQLFERAGHRYGLAYALDGSAVGLSTLDRREGTVERHLRALAIRRELGSARGEAQTLTSLGETYTRFGRYDEAADTLDQALALHRRIGDVFYQVYTLFRRARVEESRGRFTDAVRFIAQAIEIDESLRSRLASRRGRTHFSAQARWRYDLYVNSSVQSQLQEGNAQGILQALEMSEATRARAFRELLAQAQTSTTVDPELAAIRTRVEGLERERRLAGLEDASPAELLALDQRIAGALAEHEQRELAIGGQPHPLETPLSQADLRKVGRELLAEDEVLLEYYLGAGGSYVFVITTATVTAQALPRAGVINEAVLGYRRDLVARNERAPDEAAADYRARVAEADAGLEAKAKALSKLLLDPVTRWLAPAKRVIVVTDGALNELPFAALWHPAQDRWLGLTMEVVECPSIAVMEALRSRDQRVRGRGVAVIADPVFSARDPRLPAGVSPGVDAQAFLPRIPFTRDEADVLARLVPQGDLTRLLDFDATKAAVLGGAVSRQRVLHIATHGALDPDHPELSALVLGRFDAKGAPIDGYLRLQDLDGLRLAADLVVLSACETAAGKQIRGEGLISLTRGFLGAGADQVLATLWKVDDRATAALMAHFYQGLIGRSERPARALLAARRATAQRVETAAPYYWAGFTLQGDARDRP